jgi:hypothetical protein
VGLGFVLLFWLILCVCAAFPIATTLACWSWLNGLRAQTPSKPRALVAGLLPFVLIPVGMLWFLGYAAYSSSVRHVDPGLGDSWKVPVAHGYFFCMIDVTDQGYLMKGGCSGSPRVNGIRQLAQVGDSVIGTSVAGAFVFDTSTGELRSHQSTVAALAQFSPPPKLQTPDEFYERRRSGWQDRAAGFVLLGLVFLTSWFWFRRFIRAPAPRGARA